MRTLRARLHTWQLHQAVRAISRATRRAERRGANAQWKKVARGTYSTHRTEVFRRACARLGERAPDFDSGWRHNLTTDTASGYTNRRDWQAKLMGLWDGSAQYSGTATATAATSLTNSGAAFATAGQALAGRIVAVGPNASGTGSTTYGVIVSNTATVLTIDKWYDPTNPSGAAATTPNATCKYQILPGQSPAAYLALTSDSGAPTAADTFLQSELTVSGFSRIIGVWSHTAAASTYALSTTFTATGTATINKEAQFSAAFKTLNTNDGGAMPFESAEPNPPTLVSGDTLTQTVTITIN